MFGDLTTCVSKGCSSSQYPRDIHPQSRRSRHYDCTPRCGRNKDCFLAAGVARDKLQFGIGHAAMAGEPSYRLMPKVCGVQWHPACSA